MEQWKVIERAPNYEVSNYGRVRNIKRGTEKTVHKNNAGYHLVCLSHKNKKYTGYIHRLVAEAFIPTNLNKETSVVNHKDKNRSNNSIENLEWTSSLENYYHSRIKIKTDQLNMLTVLLEGMDAAQIDKLIFYGKSLM